MSKSCSLQLLNTWTSPTQNCTNGLAADPRTCDTSSSTHPISLDPSLDSLDDLRAYRGKETRRFHLFCCDPAPSNISRKPPAHRQTRPPVRPWHLLWELPASVPLDVPGLLSWNRLSPQLGHSWISIDPVDLVKRGELQNQPVFTSFDQIHQNGSENAQNMIFKSQCPRDPPPEDVQLCGSNTSG